MTYGYLRVSTDRQDENNQRVGVDSKARLMGIKIDEYIIDHGVSGAKEPEKRELGKLMNKLQKGDLVIASELSRLGRSVMMVMRILDFCIKNGVRVITVKDNYELGDNIQSKVLAFAFSLAAEIERDLISRRIKEALARKKADGRKLGRPLGIKSKTVKLSGRKGEIASLLENGHSKTAIAARLGVNRMTVSAFMKENKIPMPLTQRDYLSSHKKEIGKLLKQGLSRRAIGKKFCVSDYALVAFMKENKLG